jgi:Mg-chelatase subunit ChlD
MKIDMTNAHIARPTSLAGVLAACLVVGGTLSAACSSNSRDSFAVEGPKEEDPGFSFDDAGTAAPDGGFKCVSEQVKGEAVPLSLVILLDRSGSMSGAKWTSATNAIRAFVDRAEVVGMKVGLQFFPPLAGDECQSAVYANLSVAIDPLPGNVLPIQQRLAATSPTGGTPMGPALDGAIGGMRTWLSQNDPHAGAVILVTDGDPAGCSANIDAVATIAAAGVKPPGKEAIVRTFVVGMEGATVGNLNKVAAQGGGSPTAFNVGGGVAAQQALIEALETIRTGALSCEYILPTPKREDGVLDPASVEINFTPGANDPTISVKHVANESECGKTTGGFYYDDPSKPERIVLCPATCEAVRGAPPEGKVDVVLGCIQVTN